MIETNSFLLIRTSNIDINDLLNLYSDEIVWSYLGGLRSKEQMLKGIDSQVSPAENHEYWVVRNKTTTEFIGSISLTPHHDGKDIEISYEFLSTFWGNGHAYETIQAVINYAFNTKNLDRLVAETQAANLSSCRLLEKIGFEEEKHVIRFKNEQIIYVISK